MTRISIPKTLALAVAALALPACATTHAVRWTYQMPSIWTPPEPYEERAALRAVVGAPVIVGSAAFDLVTWPIQLIFGVWPMWGDDSTQMKPPEPTVQTLPTVPPQPEVEERSRPAA